MHIYDNQFHGVASKLKKAIKKGDAEKIKALQEKAQTRYADLQTRAQEKIAAGGTGQKQLKKAANLLEVYKSSLQPAPTTSQPSTVAPPGSVSQPGYAIPGLPGGNIYSGGATGYSTMPPASSAPVNVSVSGPNSGEAPPGGQSKWLLPMIAGGAALLLFAFSKRVR